MEIKKSKKADLEGTRTSSLLIGYIFALALIFACFEWTTREYKTIEKVKYVAYMPMEVEEVPVTEQQFLVAAPPPPADIPPVVEIINVVENDVEIKEDNIQESEQTTEATVNVVSGPVATGPVAPVGPIGPVEEVVEEDIIFEVVEKMPHFPGDNGDGQVMMAWFNKNIKYPSSAQDNNIQGTAYVQFVVGKDGSINDPKIAKSSSDKALDNEAIRVVKAMPKWVPGNQQGKPVSVKFTLPVRFRLQ